MLLRRIAFFAVCLLGALFHGCTCSDSKLGAPCNAPGDCPSPLACDLTRGVCYDPTDDGGRGDGGGDGSIGVNPCQPPAPGCACRSGDPGQISCLPTGTDPAVTASCRQGRSTCQSGTYGACTLVPVTSCTSVSVGAGSFRPTPTNSENVRLGLDGELLLTPSMKQVDFGYLWVANTGENTVSKVDVDSGREVARYASVRGSTALGVPSVPSPGAYNGDQNSCGNCPSRTAIDFNGDAFVANRAFGQQGTVTKFANDTANCVDRNGNGMVDTSRDLDGNGRIDKADPTEFLGENDECILWTVKVGMSGGVPRALAIDAGGPDGENGNVWVGLYNERRLVQISGDTGAPIMAAGQPVSVSLMMGTTAIRPYGAAIDGTGYVWVTGLEETTTTYLGKVNSVTRSLEQLIPIAADDDGCSKAYGISIDTKGRVWLGGYQCRDAKVYVPQTNTFHRKDFDNESNTRGIAVDIMGDVWVAFTSTKVARVRGDDIVSLGQAATSTLFTMPPLPAPQSQTINNTIGVGIDRNGNIWAVSRSDGNPTGVVTRIMPNAGTTESFPVGKNPYTYSDFTGYGLTTVVRPSGYYRSVVEGCLDATNKTRWRTLSWAESEPAGSTVRLRVRFADTIAGLASAAWFGPFDVGPIDLAALMAPSTRYAQVEVQLSSTSATVTPVFTGYSLTFDGCGAIID